MGWRDLLGQQPQPTPTPRQQPQGGWRQALPTASPEAPQAPPTAQEPGLGQRMYQGMEAFSDAVTGAGKNPEGLDEFKDYGQFDTPQGVGRELKIAAGMLAAVDPDAQADIVRNNVPGAQIEKDKNGNYIVEIDGKRGFINKPGLSMQDLDQFAAQMTAFIPAAKVAGLVKAVSGRIATMGGLSGLTSMGLDKAAEATGSEQGVDLPRAGVTALAGGVFEGISPLANKFIRSMYGNRQIFKNGQLTPKGRAVAMKAGIDPDELTPDNIESFLRNADDAVNPQETGAQVLADEFDVPFSQGQRTGLDRQLQREESMRKGGLGEKAQTVMTDFQDEQTAAVIAAKDKIQGQLSGGVSQIGKENDAAGSIGQSLREKAATLEDAIQDAYEIAGSQRADLSVDSLQGLSKAVKEGLKSRSYAPSAKLYPASKEAIKVIDNLGVVPSSTGKPSTVNVTSITLKKVEQARRELNNLIDAGANKADRGHVVSIKKSLDKWLDDAVDSALINGDKEALDALKQARALRAEYGKKFQAQNRKDQAGKIVEDMIELDPSPEQLTNYIFGRADLGGKNASLGMVKRIKEVLGKDSDEWNQLREMAFLRVTQGSKQGRDFSGQKFLMNLEEAVNGKGQTIMQELYTPQELALFKRFATVVKRTQPAPYNPSGTADAVSRIAQDSFKKLAMHLGMTGDVTSGLIVGAAAHAPKVLNTRAAKQAVQGKKPKGSYYIPAAGAGAGNAAADD